MKQSPERINALRQLKKLKSFSGAWESLTPVERFSTMRGLLEGEVIIAVDDGILRNQDGSGAIYWVNGEWLQWEDFND